MSRIIRGESPLIKAVHNTGKSATEATPYGMKSFRGFSVDGTFTRTEVDQFIAQAKVEGIREGAREAEQRLAVPLQQALDNLEKVMDELSHFRRDLFKESEQEVIDLVRAISKRIVLKELSLDNNLLQSIVEKAIGLLEKQKKLSITINSKDFEVFVKAKEDFLAKFKGLEELAISVDNNVQSGSALVKSQSVELDVKLDDMVDHLLSQISTTQNQVNEVNDEGDQV